MTAGSGLASETEAFPAGNGRSGPRLRRLSAPLVVVVGIAVALVAVIVLNSFASTPSMTGVAVRADSTGLYALGRQNLSSQTEVSATLGYAGSYSVVNQAQGTFTSLSAVGQVVSQGQVLYRVSDTPVVLLYGATPAYRSLSEGMTGADVEELNADLVALGFVASTELSPTSDEFNWSTDAGVAKLQAALGVTENGALSLGQAVFEPTAVRVTSVSATLGAPAQPGQPVLSATSTIRQISVALGADQQSEVAVADYVTITLPNNETTPGVISSVGSVATAGQNGGSPSITVLVNPTNPSATGSWDQAPVNATITTGTVTNALVVPVDALLAQSGRGYAVEVVDAHGVHRLVSVSLGLFDDAEGLVQVTSTGLTVGQRIVVPRL